MSNELANTGKILIYQNEKGDTKIDVFFDYLHSLTFFSIYITVFKSILQKIFSIFLIFCQT